MADDRADKIRSRFDAALKRRDAGRAEVEAANEDLGKLFAQAIVSKAVPLTELAEKAGVSRPTAYAMARRPESFDDKN